MFCVTNKKGKNFICILRRSRRFLWCKGKNLTETLQGTSQQTQQGEGNHFGDTRKQLLTRSRYLLYKNKSKWILSQAERAKLLFAIYPNLNTAYELTQQLSGIFENTKEKILGYTRLAQWHDAV